MARAGAGVRRQTFVREGWGGGGIGGRRVGKGLAGVCTSVFVISSFRKRTRTSSTGMRRSSFTKCRSTRPTMNVADRAGAILRRHTLSHKSAAALRRRGRQRQVRHPERFAQKTRSVHGKYRNPGKKRGNHGTRSDVDSYIDKMRSRVRVAREGRTGNLTPGAAAAPATTRRPRSSYSP